MFWLQGAVHTTFLMLSDDLWLFLPSFTNLFMSYCLTSCLSTLLSHYYSLLLYFSVVTDGCCTYQSESSRKSLGLQRGILTTPIHFTKSPSHPCHPSPTCLWLQPSHNAPLLSARPRVCSLWWAKGAMFGMNGGVKGGLWGYGVVGWWWWLLHEQEVLSVPLNLESGQVEQTEGERAHWRTRSTARAPANKSSSRLRLSDPLPDCIVRAAGFIWRDISGDISDTPGLIFTK